MALGLEHWTPTGHRREEPERRMLRLRTQQASGFDLQRYAPRRQGRKRTVGKTCTAVGVDVFNSRLGRARNARTRVSGPCARTNDSRLEKTSLRLPAIASTSCPLYRHSKQSLRIPKPEQRLQTGSSFHLHLAKHTPPELYAQGGVATPLPSTRHQEAVPSNTFHSPYNH